MMCSKNINERTMIMKKEIPLRRFWAACLCLALMITAAGGIAYAQSNEAAVVYISDSGNDSNDGSSVQTAVKTWEKAYELVPDESKIIVAGTSTVPDSFVPLSEKTVTISGDYDETGERGTLIPSEASMTALSFGADTVMENLIIDCSKNTSSIGMFSLYANGHDLTIGANMTMLPYPNSSYTPYPCVAAGSATIYPPLPTEPEAGNTIQIQSGQYTEIIPNGFADNTGLDAEIFLSGGVVVECLGVSECGENAEYYIIDGSADNPTQIKGIDSYNYGIVMGKLEVRDGGYLTLSGDGDFWDGWEDGGIYPASIIDLSVARGGTLCLMNSLSEGVTGDFYGGGTIIMDSGAKFAVPGAVHGETMIEIIPGKDTGEDVIDGVKLGTYITAGASGSGTFTLKNKIGAVIMPKDSQGKKEWELVRAFSVTYTDGVADEDIFEDQVYSGLVQGAQTPEFDGTPARDGYRFDGWTPAVSETVSADAVYTAQWTHVHEWSPWKQNENQHWKECKFCGETTEKETHKFGDWIVTDEPTDTKEGTKVQTCTECGYQKTEQIAALGPDSADTESKPTEGQPDTGAEAPVCAAAGLLAAITAIGVFLAVRRKRKI